MDYQPKRQQEMSDDIFERHEASLAAIEADLPPDHIARFLPDVNFADIRSWKDPVWGEVTIDASWGGYNRDEHEPYYPDLFMNLLYHPAIRRMIGIEQLTLPEQYATIPTAARFSRWEHITGSAVIVKRLVEQWNNEHPDDQVSGRELTVYMLRTMLSDIGHTLGSHLGDWIAGDENEKQHDETLHAYIEATGVGEILTRYNILPSEVILTEIDEQDFVECPSPRLCIDRVDYAIREIHRTNRYFDDQKERFTDADFRLVKDNAGILQLAMPDKNRALLFAKAYELLPKEDWSEPLQRLQTVLYTDFVRYLLTLIGSGRVETEIGRIEVRPFLGDPHEPDWIDEWDRHPRDVLMYTEAALSRIPDRIRASPWHNDTELRAIVDMIDVLLRDISNIATTEWGYRSDEVAAFTEGIQNKALVPSEQIVDRASTKFGINTSLISSISFTDTIPDQPGEEEDQLVFYLPSRKKRSLDPLVLVDGILTPLSTTPFSHGGYSPNTDAYRAQYAVITCRKPVAELHTRMKEATDEVWPSLQSRKRLSSWQLRDHEKMTLMGISAVYDYPFFIKRPYLEDILEEQSLQHMAMLWHKGMKI